MQAALVIEKFRPRSVDNDVLVDGESCDSVLINTSFNC